MGDVLALRFDFKDHLRFCSAADDDDEDALCFPDDETLNNFEASGGIMISF